MREQQTQQTYTF